jgi:hypothetical protein
MVPGMYLISERLKRPMRNMYGGRWISFLGIPPFTIIFIPLMFATMIRQRIKVARRRRKYKGHPAVNKAFIESWL